MKKYLLMTQRCPFPPYKNGGVHTIYNIINNIPEEIELDIFYYYEEDKEAEQVVKKYVNNIDHRDLRRKPNKLVRLFNFLKEVPDYFSEVDLKKYDLAIEYEKYDVIILDQIYSLPFAKYIPYNVSIISMMHDNNVMLYERKEANEKGVIKRFYDKKQCDYLKKIEKTYFDKLEKVIYVSNLDANEAQMTHKDCKAVFDNITLGVNLPQANQISRPKEHSIVFSGVMDYGPNEDAAFYFATEVFPKIKENYSKAEFVIAGKNPTKKLNSLKSDNVRLTGFVEDMYKTITSSEIYVSPLRYGSGTKNKVLEAMAAGMPVFLSEVSREGIEGLKDNINCFFIDESNITNIICEALKNKEKLKLVAKNGKEYVEKYHSWKHVFDKFLLE